MKKQYIKPCLELFEYRPERGFAWSQVVASRDYVLVEGQDRQSLRSPDEVTEYTDNSGEYTTGSWTWE